MQVVVQTEDCYMVLCSDGIYEFMTNDEIMALVHERAQQGSQPSDIAQHLVGISTALTSYQHMMQVYHHTDCSVSPQGMPELRRACLALAQRQWHPLTCECPISVIKGSQAPMTCMPRHEHTSCRETSQVGPWRRQRVIKEKLGDPKSYCQSASTQQPKGDSSAPANGMAIAG